MSSHNTHHTNTHTHTRARTHTNTHTHTHVKNHETRAEQEKQPRNMCKPCPEGFSEPCAGRTCGKQPAGKQKTTGDRCLGPAATWVHQIISLHQRAPWCDVSLPSPLLQEVGRCTKGLVTEQQVSHTRVGGCNALSLLAPDLGLMWTSFMACIVLLHWLIANTAKSQAAQVDGRSMGIVICKQLRKVGVTNNLEFVKSFLNAVFVEMRLTNRCYGP